MRKKDGALFIVLLLMLATAACNKTSQTSNNTKANAAPEATKSQPKANTAQQPTPDPNVVAVIRFMGDKNNAKKFSSYKDYGNGSAQATFTYGHKHYTVYYSGKLKDAWLSYWVRPKGTQNPASLDTFSAYTDGRVKFGMAGQGETRDRDKTTPQNKKFEKEPYSDSSAGSEYQSYWQQRFDDAIVATLKYLHKPVQRR